MERPSPHEHEAPEVNSEGKGLKEKALALVPKLKKVRTWAMIGLMSTAAVEGGTSLKEVIKSGYFEQPGVEKTLGVGMAEVNTFLESMEDVNDLVHDLGVDERDVGKINHEVKYVTTGGETLRQIAEQHFAAMPVLKFRNPDGPDRKLNAYLNARHYARLNNLDSDIDQPLPTGIELSLDDGYATFGR